MVNKSVFWIFLAFFFWADWLLNERLPEKLYAEELCDIPLETAVLTPPPIIMFVLDNSSSMNVEFATLESQGLFNNAYYLFPDSTYLPAVDHYFGSGKDLKPEERFAWRSQWAEYNFIYYSPKRNYDPWPSTNQYTFLPADLHYPLSDPTISETGAVKMSLAATFFTISSNTGRFDVPNAHYFTFMDANGNGTREENEMIFLVC